MFEKIHLAYYDVLFEIYGMLARFYSRKVKEDAAGREKYEDKLRDCIDKRDDILIIMYTLKGIA